MTTMRCVAVASVALLFVLIVSASSQRSNSAEFIKWANASGITGVFDIEVRCSDQDECGLRSRRDFKQGDVVLTVPLSTVLVAPDAPEDELDKNGQVQLQLLAQQALGDKSRFAPYIRMLPKTVLPLFTMTPEDIAILNGTQSHETFTIWNEALQSQARTLCLYGRGHEASLPHGMHFSDFHLDACYWAVSSMKSRVFHVPHPKSNVMRPGFVPLIDMMNHQHWGDPVDCLNEHNGVKACVYRAPKDIKAGDELFISYGRFLSGASVAQYGFLMDPSAVLAQWPDSRFFVEDLMEQKKAHLAAAEGCNGGSEEMREISEQASVPGGQDVYLSKLLYCERIWALTESFLKSHAKRDQSLEDLDFSQPFDVDNEQTALASVKKWLEHWIDQHGTSPASSQEDSPNKKLLVQLRSAEKRFFQEMITKVEMTRKAMETMLEADDEPRDENGNLDLPSARGGEGDL